MEDGLGTAAHAVKRGRGVKSFGCLDYVTVALVAAIADAFVSCGIPAQEEHRFDLLGKVVDDLAARFVECSVGFPCGPALDLRKE